MNPSIGKIIRFSTLSLLALSLAGCRAHDFPQYPPNYREYAYVSNGGSGTVSVFDVVNIRLDREIAVGQNPVAVAASPTRNEVYVVNSGAAGGVAGAQGTVSVVNAENNAVAATIAVHRQPVSIEIAPAGDLAYVANSGSDSVSVLDLKTRREVATIAVGQQPVSARISPDGKTLVVANRRANSVSLVDLPGPTKPGAARVRQVFDDCPGASDAVILPDSSKAFVACSAGHQIMVIALERTDLPAQAKSDPAANPARPDRLETLLDVGQAPLQLALKPDGGELFSSNSLSDSISEVVTSTNEVGGAYMMGNNPIRGLASRDNSTLYVSNFSSQYVTIYSIEDGKRIGSVHVGDGPSALGFSSAGHLLFVVDERSNDVAVVRTVSRALFTLLPTGRNPNAIAIKNFKL
jgi:YVTN family beta-propeller protein